MERIKAVVFDAYGTLFDVHSVVTACEELFPGRGVELSRLWRTKQLEYTWLLSLIGIYKDFWWVTERALQFACKALNLPDEPSTKDHLMEAYLCLDLYPDVPQGLKALSGYSLAILSNGSSEMLKAVVRKNGLEKVFPYILSAEEVQVYKPSPRVYQLAVQKIGVEARSIAFISSNSFDIMGAKAIGFWTCWLNRLANPLEEIGFTPDQTLESLTDLAKVL